MRLRTYQTRVKKMSNRKFAGFLGIGPTSLSRYYSGKSKMFTAVAADKVLNKCKPEVKFKDLRSMAGRIPEYK